MVSSAWKELCCLMMASGFPLVDHTLSEEEAAQLALRHPHVRLERDASGKVSAFPLVEGEMGARLSMLCLHLALWHGRYRTGEIFDGSTGFRLPDGSLHFPDAAGSSEVTGTPWRSANGRASCRFAPTSFFFSPQ